MHCRMNSKLASLISLLFCVLSLSQASIFDNKKFGSGPYIPWKVGTCLVPSVQENFEVDKFFTGHWYEQGSFGNYLFLFDGICPTFELNVTSNGEISVLHYHYEKILWRYNSVLGKSYTHFIKDAQGYLPITYPVLGGPATMDVPTFIVGTDYENWAVLYSCEQKTVLKAEMSWILTRARNSTDVQKAILDTLKKNHLDYSYYTHAVNDGCPRGEPHL